MNRMIYGKSVQGASHVRNNIVCQDSNKVEIISDDIVLIAVADGHGSQSCPHSKTGSKIATNVFCKAMKEYVLNYTENMEFLMTYLNREGELKVARAIDEEWKRKVWKAHTDNKREKPLDETGEVDRAAVYKQYGTTLLGLMITPSFIFALQIGDGDIMYIDENDIQPVIAGDKILGTETHSLCKIDAWKKAITMIRSRDIEEETPYLYLMSTDGFSNSYRSESDFQVTCRDYYNMIREYGFQAVASNLKEWLKETSELGCGDDITVVLAYYDQSDTEETEWRE